MSKNLKNISVVALATVASRVLGLVREMAIAAIFGTSALSSAFVSAFTLPNLFRRLLGEGALTAAFVPTMAHELEHRQRGAAFDLVSKVTSWLLVVTVSVVTLAMLVTANAETLLGATGQLGLEDDTVRRLLLGADLALILFPYMIFVCLAAAFSAACQVLGRFTEPALSPVWLNLAVLGSLALGSWWAWGDAQRMNLLCVGVLLGGFLQMAVPAGVLWREGWRPKFDLKSDDRVSEIMRLMAPTVLGSAIYLINISLSRFIGLSLNDSATQVLNLATRVMELPIGVFTSAIATVVFPLIAKHAARSEWNLLSADYHKGLRLVLIINTPAAVGLALLSEPITRLLFERGAFTATDTALMTPILAVYALGLPFLSFTTLGLRGFYALKDTSTPVRAALLSFIVNVVFSVVLMKWLSTVGLALASNLAVLAQAWFLQTRLSRKLPGLGFGPLWASLGKIAIASVAMGLIAWGAARGLTAWVLPHAEMWASELQGGGAWLGRLARPEKFTDFVVVVTVIPLAAAAYGGFLWFLKIEGREELQQLTARVRGKLGLTSKGTR